MSMSFRPLALAVSLALSATWGHAAPAKKSKETPVTELTVAHNLPVQAEPDIQAVLDRFGKEHGVRMKLVRFDRNASPAALNLIRNYEMTDVLANRKHFVPLHGVLGQTRDKVDTRNLTPELTAGTTDAKGRFVALPVAYSTPVLFYNKNALRKAKLDPEQPPRTWFEMQGMLDKLQDAGFDCPYTSSWPVWVHIDNVSALSGVPSMTIKGDLNFNQLPQVKHVAMMATWTKANFFKLYGRGNEANARFNDGECAMITTNSRDYVEFRDAKGVDLGVAPLPYHDDVFGGRQHTLADGAALWMGAGRPAAEYKLAAKFVNFMMAPDMQIELMRGYGQLPMTAAARAAASSKLLKREGEAINVAFRSLDGRGQRPELRVANIDPVRIVVDEELEATWSDKKPAKEALDTAVLRGGAILKAKPEFKKAQPF